MGSALYQRIRASGKIRYGFCYGKTYREAKEKVNKCKAALVNGKPIPDTNSRHRFSFYCDEWLRIRCRDFLHIHVLRDLCDPYNTGPHQVQAQQRQVLLRSCFCKRMSNTPMRTGNCPPGACLSGRKYFLFSRKRVYFATCLPRFLLKSTSAAMAAPETVRREILKMTAM